MVPSFTSNAYFTESSFPNVTSDISANNTPINSYVVVTQAVNVVCPPGFTKTSQNHCYQFHENNMPWENASSSCIQSYPGAYLVVISDENEQSDINNFLSDVGPYCRIYSETNNIAVWTSGRRERDDCNSGFVWKPFPDVQLPFTYTNWYSGEPTCSGTSIEFCAECYHADGYGWSDVPCYINICVLCEYELTPK